MTHEEKKNKIEEQCLLLTIKNIPCLRKYAIDSKSERPDFVLKSEDGYLGVEHFFVDTLLQKQKGKETYGSYNRQLTGKMDATYNKYKDGAIKGNEDKALREIENIINSSFEAQSNFSYSIFEKEFFRVVKDHIKNIPEYRKNLSDKTKHIGFVCEVDIPSDSFCWNVYEKGKCHKQAIKGIPLTETIWMFIQTNLYMEIFDFFAFTVIPTYKPEKAKSIYLTKTSRPKTYESFTYPYAGYRIDCNLHLQKEKINE